MSRWGHGWPIPALPSSDSRSGRASRPLPLTMPAPPSVRPWAMTSGPGNCVTERQGRLPWLPLPRPQRGGETGAHSQAQRITSSDQPRDLPPPRQAQRARCPRVRCCGRCLPGGTEPGYRTHRALATAPPLLPTEPPSLPPSWAATHLLPSWVRFTPRPRVPGEGVPERRPSQSAGPRWDRAGSGWRDPSGLSSWRLSLPAPAHSPARSCQGCALFGSCLPLPRQQPQTTLGGLKRQARGAAGSSCPAGSRAAPAAAPARPRLGQPSPPAVEETRPPRTRPARPPAPGEGW